MATTTAYYKIFDGGFLNFKNVKTIVENPHIQGEETLKGRFVKEVIKHGGADGKVVEPDAGRITKFGPVYNDDGGEFILIPEAYAAVKLPLYRAGAGTTVLIPAITAEEATAEGAGIFITPTLSEEIVYYKEAAEDLGLTFTYDNGQ